MIYNLDHICDIFGIVFFTLLSYYFINIKNKTTLEYILLACSIGGVVADLIFTFSYYYLKK